MSIQRETLSCEKKIHHFSDLDFQRCVVATQNNQKIVLTVDSSAYNKKLIAATQKFTCVDKMIRARNWDAGTITDLPKAVLTKRFSNSRKRIVYEILVVDGHHRLAFSVINKSELPVEIVSCWDRVEFPNNRGDHLESSDIIIGFNFIYREILSRLNNSPDL